MKIRYSDSPKINLALKIAADDGTVDGAHHKMWVIDQMVRALTDCLMVMRTDYLIDGRHTHGRLRVSLLNTASLLLVLIDGMRGQHHDFQESKGKQAGSD